MKKILGVIVVLAIAAVVALLMPAERKENGMQRLNRTDPEFVAIWNNLQQSEAILHNSLGEKERLLLILASNIAMQSAGMYQETLAKALEKVFRQLRSKRFCIMPFLMPAAQRFMVFCC